MPAQTFTDTDALAGCVVEKAKIVSVDYERFSVRVVTLTSNRDIPDVNIASPNVSLYRGGGINYMPQVGNICYVFTPADGTGPFIMGFVIDGTTSGETNKATTDGDIDYSGPRRTLYPGDVELASDGGGFVVLRRNGTLQLGASSTAQTVYIPVENLVRDYLVRYHKFSPMGEVVWDHTQVDDDSVATDDNRVKAIMKFSYKERFFDSKHSVEVRVGCLDKDTLDTAIDSNLLQEGKQQMVSVLGEEKYAAGVALPSGSGDKEHLFGFERTEPGLGVTGSTDNTGVVSVVINPNGGGVKYAFQLSREGDMFIRASGGIHAEVDTAFVHAPGGAKIQTSKASFLSIDEHLKAQVEAAFMEILSTGAITINGTNIMIDAGTGDLELSTSSDLRLKAGGKIVLDAPTIHLGKGAKFDLMANASAWAVAIDGHTHPGTTPQDFPATPTPAPVSTVGVRTSKLPGAGPVSKTTVLVA